jgi:IS30 family transposase
MHLLQSGVDITVIALWLGHKSTVTTLIGHLRSRRTMRHSRKAGTHGESRGQIPDAVSIRDRPAEIEDRAVPGHWEGDLISGTRNSHIVALVERQSRYTALVKVANKETATVVAALTRQIRRLPMSLRRSLTWDRGHEMAKHKLFTVATKRRIAKNCRRGLRR